MQNLQTIQILQKKILNFITKQDDDDRLTAFDPGQPG